MKTFTINELFTILENSTKFSELSSLQLYLNENKPFYSMGFYAEITKKINKKFAIIFLNINYDPIFN